MTWYSMVSMTPYSQITCWSVPTSDDNVKKAPSLTVIIPLKVVSHPPSVLTSYGKTPITFGVPLIVNRFIEVPVTSCMLKDNPSGNPVTLAVMAFVILNIISSKVLN